MKNTGTKAIYTDPSQPLDKRVADLVARMTLEEKASQMLNASPAIDRLDIPEYNWWNECLHGVARAGVATVFPQAIGLAATFDVDLIFRVATAISDEARAKYHLAQSLGNRGIYKGLTFWTPNVNIFRDPRWGRGQETYGEDPFVTTQIGLALVKGLQGDHPKYLKVAACVKHFAVHSGPESKRHGFNAEVSLKDLHETYLPAFKALVDAGVEAVMGAYNRTNGEPCCGSKLLLVDILRNTWKFDGHVVSDCGAIDDFHNHHKITSSPEESVALAVKNGCDLNCGCTYKYLVNAVKQGLLDEKTIDQSVTRLFKTRFKLGMFDPPEAVPYTQIAPEVINCDRHRQLAREAAAKSIVLLKNQHDLLPLKKTYKKIVVLGPNAANIHALLGNYYGLSKHYVTLLEGITNKIQESTTVEYRMGCLLDRPNAKGINWSVFEARDSELVIAVFGLDSSLEGEEGDAIASDEAGDRTRIRLPQWQEEYLREVKATGTPVVLILAGGSPIAIPEDIADAILFIWYPGEEGGNAVADILFGDVAPCGRLPITFPKSLDQLPPYEDYALQGRTYRYSSAEPLFPFGFGLSYTTFAYHSLRLSTATINAGENLQVEVSVTNTGDRDAEDVVQLYLTDLQASVAVPFYALKGFRRVCLQAQETKLLTFTITPEMMIVIDQQGRSVIESGEFRVTVGGSSPGAISEKLGAPQPVSGVFTVTSC
jgi:beta-glucosidase